MGYRAPGLLSPSLAVGGLSYAPATVAGGAAAGATAGSLSSTLAGSVSYSVLSGALAVNASTGALTTTGTAPSSGSIPARVIADNGSQIVGAAISVPVQAVAATAPVAQGAPTISGLAASGNTLTVTPGTYSGATSVTGQWQKNGVAISGATGASYTVQASDGPNVAYLETATGSGGATISQRVVSKYLGQVASQCRISERLSATSIKQSMSRSPHVAMDNLTSWQMLFANYYWASTQNTVTDKAEHGSQGTLVLKVSVEYPAGTITPVTFGGATSSPALASATSGITDTINVAIPKGARFWVRTYAVFSSSIVFWEQFDYVNGGAFAFGATVTDLTAGGTIANTNSGAAMGSGNTNGGTASASTLGYGPSAIFAPTALPSVALVGDSRCEGWGDTFDGSGDTGELARSLGSMPYINLGSFGDTINKFNASHSARVGIFCQYVSHVICETGINDITSGSSTFTSDQQTLWNTFASLGLPVYASTMPPVTTSSDNWATTANQTPNANNAARVQANNLRRSVPSPLAGCFEVADAVESARDSGLWKATGSAYGYTVDGTHENQAGYLLVKNGGAISPAFFVR